MAGPEELVERLKADRRSAHLNLVGAATRFPGESGFLALIQEATRVLELDAAIAVAGNPATIVTRTEHVEIQEPKAKQGESDD